MQRSAVEIGAQVVAKNVGAAVTVLKLKPFLAAVDEDERRLRKRLFMTVERDALKRQYGDLFASISEVLFEAKPMGINFGSSEL